MNRIAMFICAAMVALLGLAWHGHTARAADGSAGWVSAPAMPPDPPTGAQPSPYPLPIGYVGDIEFWAPNRGLLITAGNSVVPAGLFAFNGVQWHQLSTVCGATDGRIAWAGPDDFWTISDQRQGQVLTTSGNEPFEDVSLCHFQNGQVVTSYALPLQQPNSYQPMFAAACTSTSNCWFGGALDSNGAFHLHWDGSTLSQVDAPQDHEIASMTTRNGQILESVQVQPGDSFATDPNGNDSNPWLLHAIAPQDPTNPFHDQLLSCGNFCTVPEYGAGEQPDQFDGLALSSDSRVLTNDGLSAASQLWAAASPVPGSSAPPIVLRLSGSTWTQVVGAPGTDADITTPLGGADDDVPLPAESRTPTPESVAAEPASNAAWIGLQSLANPDQSARVDRIAINSDGTASVTDEDILGTAQDGVGPQGPTSAVSCPAPQDCWLATTQGWLFHLTDGTQYPQDTDPNFASVITFRPSDAGVPAVITDTGTAAAPPAVPPAPALPKTAKTPTKKPVTVKAKALVTKIGKPRLVHKTILELPITLSAKAHVRLIARRHGKTVAETGLETLGAGKRVLKLRLKRKRWPTGLALKASPVNKPTSTSGGGSGGGSAGGGTVTT